MAWDSPPTHLPTPHWFAATSPADRRCASPAPRWRWSAMKPFDYSGSNKLPRNRGKRSDLRKIQREIDMKRRDKSGAVALLAGGLVATGAAAADAVSYQELADALHTVMESDRT